MGSIMNGFAYHGIFTISGSTFLVFADYMRATVRVAALAELQVSYIWTHDSIGVGEDGPTHQPVETVSGLRVIPNLDVIRPADAEETVGAYVASIDRKTGPTALILSRQNLEQMSGVDVNVRREGTLKGAYVTKPEVGELKKIVMGAGSEVQHLMAAFKDRHGGGGERTLAQVQRPGRKGNSKTQRTEVAIEAWLVEDERLAKVAADLEDEDDDESYNRPGRF